MTAVVLALAGACELVDVIRRRAGWGTVAACWLVVIAGAWGLP